MLDKKEILKSRKDLLELHKRCLVSYFAQISLRHRTKKKFFKIYDKYIDTDNIQCFFFRDLKLFVYALVTDRLDEISDYIPKRHRLNTKRKKKK